MSFAPQLSRSLSQGQIEEDAQEEDKQKDLEQSPDTGKDVHTASKLKENDQSAAISRAKSMYGTPQTAAKNPEVNIVRLCLITFVIGMGNLQTGFAISGNNQTAPVIQQKFGWTDDEAVLYNTIISSSAIFGVVTGSLSGGKFITKGRRICLIIFNFFAAIATGMTMFLNYETICIGRFLFGFCCGVFSVAGPKMLDETVPTHLNSSFGTATNSFMSGGIMIALLLGAFLPEDDDKVGQGLDENWRIIYGFPFICQFLTVFLFVVVFRQDSITFSISKKDDAGALEYIKMFYAKTEDPDQILLKLKGMTEAGASGISLGEACCDRRYKRATWVAFFVCFFQQQTGLDGIMIYSNTIFREMARKGAIQFTAKQGSYIVGCVSFVGSILAPIPLSMFGRRTLLFWGQVVMGLSLAAVGAFQLLDMTMPLILGICVFITGFQFTQGPIAWMYAAEVAVDTALGLCILALFLSLLEKAITMEFIVHSFLGPHGMFFMLSAITLVGAIFMAVFVKETKGLPDKQKKQLYTPVDILEQDAKDQDVAQDKVGTSSAKANDVVNDPTPTKEAAKDEMELADCQTRTKLKEKEEDVGPVDEEGEKQGEKAVDVIFDDKE